MKHLCSFNPEKKGERQEKSFLINKNHPIKIIKFAFVLIKRERNRAHSRARPEGAE